ncbi:MAG: hypothetical protein PVI71_10050, partial [Desulfobacterales bacterium]
AARLYAAVGIGPLGLHRGESKRICCRMFRFKNHCCGSHAAGAPCGLKSHADLSKIEDRKTPRLLM